MLELKSVSLEPEEGGGTADDGVGAETAAAGRLGAPDEDEEAASALREAVVLRDDESASSAEQESETCDLVCRSHLGSKPLGLAATSGRAADDDEEE